MFGIVIEYEFKGDEDAWRAACDGFVKSIDEDPALRGKFSYRVTKHVEGNGRTHIGRWDRAETLAHLQDQTFFKEFAAALQGFADGGLTPTRVSDVAATAGAR